MSAQAVQNQPRSIEPLDRIRYATKRRYFAVLPALWRHLFLAEAAGEFKLGDFARSEQDTTRQVLAKMSGITEAAE